MLRSLLKFSTVNTSIFAIVLGLNIYASLKRYFGLSDFIKRMIVICLLKYKKFFFYKEVAIYYLGGELDEDLKSMVYEEFSKKEIESLCEFGVITKKGLYLYFINF